MGKDTLPTLSLFLVPRPRSPPSRGCATSTAFRSSCAAPGPDIPAGSAHKRRCRAVDGRLNRNPRDAELNLVAVVEPNVITGELQRAVERVGLFYPPDPASLETSSIGGNVAECAGGPRAFKYGTTKRYVLALEAVLPTGEILHTGSKAVKNVVGYDVAATRRVRGHAGDQQEDHASPDSEARHKAPRVAALQPSATGTR